MRRVSVAGCWGKKKFDSPKLAYKVKGRHGKFSLKRDVYRCKCCGFYHLGTKIKGATYYR